MFHVLRLLLASECPVGSTSLHPNIVHWNLEWRWWEFQSSCDEKPCLLASKDPRYSDKTHEISSSFVLHHCTLASPVNAEWSLLVREASSSWWQDSARRSDTCQRKSTQKRGTPTSIRTTTKKRTNQHTPNLHQSLVYAGRRLLHHQLCIHFQQRRSVFLSFYLPRLEILP